jgi:hypothetical protein
MWEDRSAIFELYRTISTRTKKKQWYIRWTEKKKRKGIGVYQSELDESGMEMIPYNPWELYCGGGVQPTPRVLFVPCKDAN